LLRTSVLRLPNAPQLQSQTSVVTQHWSYPARRQWLTQGQPLTHSTLRLTDIWAPLSTLHRLHSVKREALWRAVGAAAREAAKRDDPTWLSTAGTGVPWLHIRLDARPKYYHHLDYKKTRSDKRQKRR